MPLPTSSLAKICNSVRQHVETLGQETSPTDWDVAVKIGAPGSNLASTIGANTLNLFFYRFEPFGFDADAMPGDVQWIKVFCVITAAGVDEDVDSDEAVDFSAGFNELRMLAQVMRLFQEQPVMLFEGSEGGDVWHTQFIPRPLADEQINQIWSSQGEAIYRPSVVYEIALAPIEPRVPAGQAARVGRLGHMTTADMAAEHDAWPAERSPLPPLVPVMHVNIANPQWAPATALLTGTGVSRSCQLSLNFEIPNGVGDAADFSSFPQVEVWIAGDTSATGGVRMVGQLLQNPSADSSAGHWSDIDIVTGLTPDDQTIDPESPPAPGGVAFVLQQAHWSGIDNTYHSWQLHLYAERFIRQRPEDGQWVNATEGESGLRIRSNPLLITLVRGAG